MLVLLRFAHLIRRPFERAAHRLDEQHPPWVELVRTARAKLQLGVRCRNGQAPTSFSGTCSSDTSVIVGNAQPFPNVFLIIRPDCNEQIMHIIISKRE